MENIVLDRAKFRDKVFACWTGKNIGGTLGEPWECKKHTHALTYYEPVPGKAAPNDDLDLQLIWLKMLEEQGTDPSVSVFAEYWDRYACRYPWNEYGFFMRNFERGLYPPVAGCFENYFVDEMGSPIRSEIWACLHPADPQSAARMAWKDSALDHAGGEGMYGEMFWAALQSAAFVESDPFKLIQTGLNMIPLSSHVGRSIREAVWCYHSGRTWGEARERIAGRFGHLQPCNAVPNHGFTIIGWLYGKDFGDRLCKAVNCGYDTDCTGATLGALLGITGGTEGIPPEWSSPIGNEIVLHPFTGDCGAPADIEELTERTLTLAESALSGKRGVKLGDGDVFPADVQTRLFRNSLAREALRQDIDSSVKCAEDGEIRLHYGGEPVIRPGIGKDICVSLVPDTAKRVDLTVPEGWKLERTGNAEFRIFAGEKFIKGINPLYVSSGNSGQEFVILGPEEAGGFEAGKNVETCPECRARAKACICRGSG